MDRLATGKFDVEIRRHRSAIKTWIVKRIADTPVVNESEMEASSWFHEMPVESRSKILVDLARMNVDGVDLYEIATGPLGELFTRFSHLFIEREAVASPLDSYEMACADLSLTVGTFNEIATSDTSWYEGWQQFEQSLEENDTATAA